MSFFRPLRVTKVTMKQLPLPQPLKNATLTPEQREAIKAMHYWTVLHYPAGWFRDLIRLGLVTETRPRKRNGTATYKLTERGKRSYAKALAAGLVTAERTTWKAVVSPAQDIKPGEREEANGRHGAKPWTCI